MATSRPSSSDLSFFFSKPKHASSSASNASSSSGTRVVVVQKAPVRNAKAGALQVTARSATPSSVSSLSHFPDLKGKRKSPEPDAPHIAKKQRVATPAVEDDAASTQSVAPGPSRRSSAMPSLRGISSSDHHSASRSPMPSSSRATSRSRSPSVLRMSTPMPRECWTEEDGTPGPSCLTSEAVVQDLMKTYKSYFKNPNDPADRSFEPHPEKYPVVELEYPNNEASEKFILLAPKDPDHYNPIMCLESSLHTIVKDYLTPAQRAMFGTLPDACFSDREVPIPYPPTAPQWAVTQPETSSPSPPPMSSASSPAPSVSETSSSVTSSSSLFSSASSASSASSVSPISSLSSVSSLSSLTDLSNHATPCALGPPSVDYLRLLQRAINKHDGPLFLKVMNAINALLRLLKYPPVPSDPFDPTPSNHLREVVRSWGYVPQGVIERVVEEVYQRAVGPNVAQLRRYQAFSSEAYGELMPTLVSRIVRETGLHEGSLFLDLGSGVGNVVLQASLQTGCTSYGIELMAQPAKLARSQLEQFRIRCRMWGFNMGEVELEEGDMLSSKRVDELIPKADVVLVNNRVFDPSLNEAIRPKFLDLKEGAIVVSLQEFAPLSGVTERNLDDISAIFQVTQRNYHPGNVSWHGKGGDYYLHRVDRECYASTKQQFENTTGTRTKPMRSSRLRR